ncbi:sensor histidine kinase [Nocardioides solisilvae]|uniref:sensor histidine kinase n=1 Tax=Nocardioides solisilvae TaxID=1542435 RepID=UPI000D74CBE7|nr:ATP-binding protein [Nocardioides solisilvae]
MSKKRPAPEGTARRSRSLHVPEWPMRRKLALVLTVPMLLAAVFGGLRVSDAVRDLRDVESTQAQLTVLHPLVDYFDAVEEAAVVLHSTERGAPERAEALAAVRETAQVLQERRDAADLTGEQGRTLDRTIGASIALQDESGYAETAPLLGQLRMLYAGIQEFADLVVSDQLVPEPHLPQLAFAIGGRLAFTVQQIQVDRTTGDVHDAYDVYGDLGMEQAALDQLLRIRGAEEIVLGLSQASETRRAQVVAGNVDQPYASTFALYDQLISSILDDTEATLSQWAEDAERDALVSAGVTAGALLLAVLLALFVARLLVRPVLRVRDEALVVANETLPATVARIRAGEDPDEIEPIDVTTNEEMGQLARAVDDMHRAAVRLAAGEARIKSQVGEMFVTLSRRNTSLVNQQLSLIERLEQDEDDPERLQSLFRLDHLAARMRRTAESLVILSDAPVRQREQPAMSAGDVIQAAAGGVQQYERVQIMGFPTEKIDGSAAADVVHLLTELIDNALSFSPPSCTVEVTTTTSVDETVIRVNDSGLGMSRQQMDALNEMLRSGGEVTPDTARRMGLFVVSRLARRHGITVQLATNSRGGVLASVVLPPALLAAQPVSLTPVDPPAPAPVPSGAPALAGAGAGTAGPALGAPPVDPIVAAINAVTGLPQRRPGASRGADAESAPTGMFDRPAPTPAVEPDPVPAPPAPTPLLPRAEGGTAPGSGDADTPGTSLRDASDYRVPLLPRREIKLPPPDAEEPAPVPAARPVAEPRAGTATALAEPLPDLLNDPLQAPYETINHGRPPVEPGESPIFASLQSSWLGQGDHWGPADADAGWRAAQAATEQVAERTESGLPQRRPGNRLVPGTAAAAPAPAAPLRDPEAVRARLNAHVSGVSRGRSATTQNAPIPEEAGPA